MDHNGRHPLRVVSALVVMFCSLLYLVAIFKGAGHLFERFFNVPYDVAIGLALVVVMIYTSIGGFVSVVRTDALQGVLMMIGAVLIFYFVTSAAGGIGAIADLSVMPDKQFLFEINGGILFVVLESACRDPENSSSILVRRRVFSRSRTRQHFARACGCYCRPHRRAALLVSDWRLRSSVDQWGHRYRLDCAFTVASNAAIFPFGLATFCSSPSSRRLCRPWTVLLVAASTGYKNLVQPAPPRWPVGPAEAGSVDSFDGGCFGDHSRRACIGATGGHSPDNNIFRQSLRGMFFAGSGSRAVLVQRKFNRRAGVDGGWHNHTVDCWI